jgi:hypothetical protein
MSETDEKGVLGGAPAADFFADDAQLFADAAPFRAPSRPQPIGGSRKGVPNRRTAAMRDLYLRMGLPHPLIWMGQVLKMGVDGLAEELGCQRLEAAELLRKVASDALPYIEGKQPLRVQAEGGGLPVMIVGDLGQARQAIADARSEGALAIDDDIELAMIAHERNQGLSGEPGASSHGDASHDEVNALKSRDNPS